MVFRRTRVRACGNHFRIDAGGDDPDGPLARDPDGRRR